MPGCDAAVCARFATQTGGGGVGTGPWWLALLACGSAYWLSPLNLLL